MKGVDFSFFEQAIEYHVVLDSSFVQFTIASVWKLNIHHASLFVFFSFNLFMILYLYLYMIYNLGQVAKYIVDLVTL